MTEQLKGKYVLDRLLGCGGMAEVFVGRALGAAGFSRQVAIKRIHRGYSSHAQFRQMFEAEARLSSRLRHSNVVSVLDFDEDEAGCLFLVMEYVDGIDLDGLLGTGLLPLPAVLFITSEILRGLAYVHELPLLEGGPLGLVHRDVSPQNVLLSWDGAVQVSDFGIAKARTATLAGASLSLKGKPAYMSPEQARGLSLDGRSDTFAAGVMLWEMLCGHPLFHDPNDLAATLAAVMFADPPPPHARARRPIPDDIERVTMALLRRNRDDRPDAATALAAVAACADYPRNGRELLAALLAARLPDRAPRRSQPRRPQPALPEARPGADAQLASPRARITAPDPRIAPPRVTTVADASDASDIAARPTVIAPPDGRPRPRLLPPRSFMLDRLRRSAVRRALLGAIAIGAATGGVLHVAFGGNSSAAQSAAPPPAPIASDAIEPARSVEPPSVRPPEPARAGAPPPRRAIASESAADRSGPSKELEQPGADGHAGGSSRPPRRRARAPTSSAPPPASGMRIIDLRPELPESGRPERAQRGIPQVDLGLDSTDD